MSVLDPPPMPRACGKCLGFHGNDWSQCEGKCPVVGSPHFDRQEYERHGDPYARKPTGERS